MDVAITILAIAATVVFVTAIADRTKVSAPLLLMLVGIGISFVPFVRVPGLSADLVLFGFLPPLLYAAAIRTSVIDFRANRVPIAGLSVLLVVVTALGVGVIAWQILDIPFAVAFALGAVVAPPDAVAATTIARQVGMPRRLVSILEGESLVNDATAITCLRVAILAIGGGVTAFEVGAGFLIAAVGGVVCGVAVAALAAVIRRRNQQPVFDTAISLMLPYAAYLPAELIGWGDFHGSGVISVVVAGLILGHKSPVIQDGQSRLNERINWATIQFLLENTVFLMIGFQARRIVTDLRASEVALGLVAGICAAVLVGVIVIRMVWVALFRIALFRQVRDPDGKLPPWSHTVVLGWAGLRGVVTLAAAFLLPTDVAERPLLIFVAMVVTAGTLLLQGLTLPVLVRRLGLRGPDARSDALQAATVIQSSTNAALAELDRIRTDDDAPETIEMLRTRISSRPHALWEKLGRSGDTETPAEEYRRLRLATIAAERTEILKIRSSGTVDHEVIETVLGTLDVEESTLTVALERSDRVSEVPVQTPTHPEGECLHLNEAATDTPDDLQQVCDDCVREGTRTVHLRVCLTCAKVSCCDSSPARHAERHFHTSRHPVMQSYEPDEQWRWCYVDERIG